MEAVNIEAIIFLKHHRNFHCGIESPVRPNWQRNISGR